MKLIRYSSDSMGKAYGISCSNDLHPNNSCGASFFPSLCRVEQGGETLIHSHYETEIFIVTKGRALAVVEGEEVFLDPNDQLLVHPFEEHIIKNIGSEPLEFFAIYSRVNYKNDTKKSNTLIISAPPTPNGGLHLGHLSGPYLSADILKRFLSLREKKVKHFSSTDDNQTYTFKMARDYGKDQEEILQKYHEIICSDLRQASIEVDDFFSTSKDDNYKIHVKEKFEQLKKSDAVSIKKIEFPFLDGYKYEAFLEGICPDCQKKSCGQCCESCGFVGEASDFNRSNLKSKECLTLDLSEFREFLKQYHNSLNLQGEVAKRAKKWRRNLSSFTLNYPENIGIDGMHVWCEMAFGMLYQINKYSDKVDELIYCFGIDNSYYYLVLIPSILKALGEEGKLPNKVIINGFYNLNDQKFSTSKGHAIWVKDIDKSECDNLRLYLSLFRPEGAVGNYNHDEFLKFSNEMNLKLSHLRSLEKSELNGASLIEADHNFYKKLVRKLLSLENSMSEDFSLNEYASNAIQILNDYLSYIEFSEDTLEKKKIFIPLIKMAFYPIMPNTFELSDFNSVWSLDLRRNLNEK